MHPLSTLWKHLKSLTFFDVFRRQKKRGSGTNGSKQLNNLQDRKFKIRFRCMIIRSFWGNFVSIFTIPSKNHRKCYFFTIAREMSKTYSLTNFCLWAKLTLQKMKFSIKDCSSKCDQETADLVTFTGEIPNGKFHFLCSDHSMKSR